MSCIYHVATLDPPSPHRNTWIVTCSNGDLSMSFLNRVEAIMAISDHINNAILINELEQGTYHSSMRPE